MFDGEFLEVMGEVAEPAGGRSLFVHAFPAAFRREAVAGVAAALAAELAEVAALLAHEGTLCVAGEGVRAETLPRVGSLSEALWREAVAGVAATLAAEPAKVAALLAHEGALGVVGEGVRAEALPLVFCVNGLWGEWWLEGELRRRWWRRGGCRWHAGRRCGGAAVRWLRLRRGSAVVAWR